MLTSKGLLSPRKSVDQIEEPLNRKIQDVFDYKKLEPWIPPVKHAELTKMRPKNSSQGKINLKYKPIDF